MSRESILPQVEPNPIPGFKDQCLAPFVGMLNILVYLPFNLLLDVEVQVFNKRSFFKTIFAQHLLKYRNRKEVRRNRKEVRRCEGLRHFFGNIVGILK